VKLVECIFSLPSLNQHLMICLSHTK